MDCRTLNFNNCPDWLPMPCIDELTDRLGKAKFISVLDLTQMGIEKEAKTALSSCKRLYEWTHMLMGLKDSSATCQVG